MGQRISVSLMSELPVAPHTPPALQTLPESARTIYGALAQQGPLTHRDLLRATGMPARTIRYAVGRLKEAGVIGARCSLQDCRQCYFYVARECPGDGQSPFVKTRWNAL
jgi:DNA-binding transcriptional ArsR family regulator